MLDNDAAQQSLANLLLYDRIPAKQREKIQKIVAARSNLNADFTYPVQQELDQRFSLIQDTIHKDIEQNKIALTDLDAWSR